MKVLFLDIDGVCNCVDTKIRFGGFIGIDPDMAERVRRIVAETGCKVVLSSTWRLNVNARRHVREKVVDYIGLTPRLPGEERGREISAWLSKHPEVSIYAILDDDSDLGDYQPLFRTDWHTGLTPEIADKVIEHLGKVPAAAD